jgi:uncharacterized protein YcfJ
MSRFVASLLAAALAATTAAASAQDYPAGYNDPPAYGDRIAPLYEYAEVVRVDPIIGRDERYAPADGRNCYQEGGYYTDRGDGRYDDRYDDRYGSRHDDRYRSNDPWYTDDNIDRSQRSHGTQTGRNVATLLGGLVGAALGSKVGGGSARYATAAVGSMVGSMAGREIYEGSQRQRHEARVAVCDPVSEDAYRDGQDDVVGYDVTYRYGGREYTTRTDHHPGDRIRVRVDVRAE